MTVVVALLTPSPSDPAAFRTVDPADALLSALDEGVQRGDGVFETIGVMDGRLLQWEPHLARLANSAAMLELPAPPASAWRDAVTGLLRGRELPGEWALKLLVTRGVGGGDPVAWLQLWPAPGHAARQAGLSVVTLDRGYPHGIRRTAPWLLLGAKTTSYAVNMAALREARRRGADDVLFHTSDGFAMEGPTSTLVVRLAGEYVTPDLDSGILHGTTQQALFAWLEGQGVATEYRPLPLNDVLQAEGVWLLSSLRQAAPVRRLDGHPVAADDEATTRINEALLGERR